MDESAWRKLLTAARAARANAYAPYSGFAVGAALVTEDGQMFAGCNVENASYGLTNCAERTALFSMAATGARHVAALAVVADSTGPASPCGACRQVMAEFCRSETPVLLANLAGDTRLTTAGGLLPHAFLRSDMQP